MKETLKFAPGDEIVIIDANGWDLYESGYRGKVTAQWGSNKEIYEVEFESGQKSAVFGREMELAAIVDSPLWKALT